ncbi:MAG: WGR domain-containing protein [Myxococcales bacterium]|nr:WGR domain-containing protein [Myxococcales bacterium]
MSLRRFEFVQGNQAKFWEVTRRGATLTVRSGRIGGSSKEARTKQLDDYMAAEREFDRLIRDKLRRGYVEVAQASEPEQPMPDRLLVLKALDGEDTLEMKPAATRYIVWRMVEVGVMDKQEEPPDLQRWLYRATRRMRMEEVPDDSHPEAEAFWALYDDLSEPDRRQESRQHGVVGAYKLSIGTDWIITPKEAAVLAEASRSRTPRRHKVSANQQSWLEDWIAFNDKAADAAGYVVECLEETA